MICTHQAHQNPQKNAFLLQQNWFLEGFGVPGGCKSILIVKSLHKSHIAELFGPRVFCFSVGQKIQKSRQKWWFWADLKKKFNIVKSKIVYLSYIHVYMRPNIKYCWKKNFFSHPHLFSWKNIFGKFQQYRNFSIRL